MFDDYLWPIFIPQTLLGLFIKGVFWRFAEIYTVEYNSRRLDKALVAALAFTHPREGERIERRRGHFSP